LDTVFEKSFEKEDTQYIETSSFSEKKKNIEYITKSQKIIQELHKFDNYDFIKVKHIVIGGGGTLGFVVYGFLKESYGTLWHHSKLKSLYGTSVGSIISTFISLNIEWSILDSYIINRPWHNIFKFDFKNIIYSINNCGLFSIDTFKDIFGPLLKYKGLDMDITLKEFYEWNKIDMHFYLTEIYAEDGSYFKNVDISHTTHPHWKLIDAIYGSSALPVFLRPLIKDDSMYIDGGILNTFPINDCIRLNEITESNSDEVCAFYLNSLDLKATNCKEKKDILKTSLYDLILFIIIQIILEFTFKHCNIYLKHNYRIKSSNINGFEIHLAASDSTIRRKMIEEGVEYYKNNCKEKNDECEKVYESLSNKCE
jgi:NTE family protein